jgi:hypothetical protein
MNATALDINNIDSVETPNQTSTSVIEDGWTEAQIQKAVELLNNDKASFDEIKTSLAETFGDISDVDGLLKKGQSKIWSDEVDARMAAAALIDPRHEEIRKLKKENETVLESLDEDSADVVLPEFDEADDLDTRIRVLNEIQSILYKVVEKEPPLPPDPGTFGKFNGPFVVVNVVGEPDPVFIDVDGVDIYKGRKLAVTPWVQKKIDEACKRHAEDWLDREQERKEALTYEGDEYPVRILPSQPGPKWNDKVLYGIAGEIVRKVSAHCESHPAGMLLDFLVSFGSIVGRGPYFNIGATQHFTNEFMCRVGDSSKSRKGTGRDAIDDVLKYIDSKWYADRVTSGFGSAEAIISQIKDTTTEMRQVKGVYSPVVVRGVDDKRLYIREGELASIFVLAGKTESRADIVLRDGWDGKALRNIVKGKTSEGLSNSAKCEAPHLSISGDTTIHELRRKMPKGSDENGFGNRFIYVYVYRVKDCPLGGPQLDWSKEIEKLCLILRRAQQVKHVNMTGAARQWWVSKYHTLEHDGPDGVAGKMTARAAAHVRRIAMLYALLDMSEEIDTVHFQAAKKLWDYCAESAVFIFGGITSEQLRIQNWIGLRQTATYKQVRDELYHRNKPVGEIKADLATLVAKNLLHLAGDIYSKKGV